MQLTRIYYNTSGDTLRIDKVNISVHPNYNTTGAYSRFGPQKVDTITVSSSSSLASSRVITDIELVGEYDDWDKASPYNMTWASRTLGDDQVLTFDMSNFPKIGETI